MKKTILFIVGLCSGICLVMMWFHRGLIAASIKGEPLPKAPKGCPAYKDEAKDEVKEEAKDEKTEYLSE